MSLDAQKRTKPPARKRKESRRKQSAGPIMRYKLKSIDSCHMCGSQRWEHRGKHREALAQVYHSHIYGKINFTIIHFYLF
jgi:hypothetical protein